MASKGFTPVKTGHDPRTEAGRRGDGDEKKGRWLKLQPGEVKDLVILCEAEDILASEQCAIWMKDGNSPVWVYTGPEDPCHDLGLKRAYKAFLPVLELVDGKPGDVAIWSVTKSVHIALLDVADASGELKGLEVRVKRTGSSLATRYSVIPRGKRRDVRGIEEPNILDSLGPLTSDGVKELIAQKLGEESYEDVLEKYRGKANNGSVSRESVDIAEESKPKKKAKRVLVEDVEDEEEDSLDDLELK
jgi:hypothetical protein